LFNVYSSKGGIILFAKATANIHYFCMADEADELIPTRATLIHRLKDWQDQASWQFFFDTYWQLIYGIAIKRGLTKPEAEDVVQLTMISVAKHMPGFKYDPAIGNFKTWLLNMTSWRITDQHRKRKSLAEYQVETVETGSDDSAIDDDTFHTLPELENLWDAEWENNLLQVAIAKARRRADPKQYQIFDCHVNKQWPPERIAKAFGISINQVYLAKHRMTTLIKEEAERVRKEII
jgi:RNA polymerase sigma factor (sigma-70 family)